WGVWWALASVPLVALWCLTLPEAPPRGSPATLEKPRISIVSVDGFVVTEKPPEGGVWRIRSGSAAAPREGTTLMIRQGGTPLNRKQKCPGAGPSRWLFCSPLRWPRL